MAEILDIVETGATLGESPVWSVRDSALYWIDIKAPAIHRYDPVVHTDDMWSVEQEIGSIALHRDVGLVAGLRDGLALIGADMTTIDWLSNPEPDKPMNRFNDGKCDRQGASGPAPCMICRDRQKVTMNANQLAFCTALMATMAAMPWPITFMYQMGWPGRRTAA